MERSPDQKLPNNACRQGSSIGSLRRYNLNQATDAAFCMQRIILANLSSLHISCELQCFNVSARGLSECTISGTNEHLRWSDAGNYTTNRCTLSVFRAVASIAWYYPLGVFGEGLPRPVVIKYLRASDHRTTLSAA